MVFHCVIVSGGGRWSRHHGKLSTITFNFSYQLFSWIISLSARLSFQDTLLTHMSAQGALMVMRAMKTFDLDGVKKGLIQVTYSLKKMKELFALMHRESKRHLAQTEFFYKIVRRMNSVLLPCNSQITWILLSFLERRECFSMGEFHWHSLLMQYNDVHAVHFSLFF